MDWAKASVGVRKQETTSRARKPMKNTIGLSNHSLSGRDQALGCEGIVEGTEETEGSGVYGAPNYELSP